MSSRIQVNYSTEDYAQFIAALPPEDLKAICDIAMKHLVDDFMKFLTDDFMKRFHLLVSTGCEVPPRSPESGDPE